MIETSSYQKSVSALKLIEHLQIYLFLLRSKSRTRLHQTIIHQASKLRAPSILQMANEKLRS